MLGKFQVAWQLLLRVRKRFRSRRVQVLLWQGRAAQFSGELSKGARFHIFSQKDLLGVYVMPIPFPIKMKKLRLLLLLAFRLNDLGSLLRFQVELSDPRSGKVVKVKGPMTSRSARLAVSKRYGLSRRRNRLKCLKNGGDELLRLGLG